MAYMLLYPPERYTTTSVHHTFPETHYPMEKMFHRIGAAAHDFAHPYETDIRTPHADIRETQQNYYIDIELPGLTDDKKVKLHWTSSRTLLIEAKIERPSIPEDALAPTAEASGSSAAAPTDGTPPDSVKMNAPTHPIHYLARERRLGVFARAFYFSIEVDHDSLEATLKAGVLRLVVRKVETEHKESKKVKVQSVEG